MSPRALYRLADALELTLEYSGELPASRIRGKRTRKVELAGVPVSGELEVVSSVLLAAQSGVGKSGAGKSGGESGAALLLRAAGSLGVFISYAEPGGLQLTLCDLDRLVPAPEELFEQNCPTDLAAAQALLAPAVVARFRFQDGNWLAVATPPA